MLGSCEMQEKYFLFRTKCMNKEWKEEKEEEEEIEEKVEEE